MTRQEGIEQIVKACQQLPEHVVANLAAALEQQAAEPDRDLCFLGDIAWVGPCRSPEEAATRAAAYVSK